MDSASAQQTMPEVPGMGDLVQDALKTKAENSAKSAMRRELKKRLPHFLHPLIPGVGGSVEGRLAAKAKRYVAHLVGSILFTMFFVLTMGTVIVVSGLIVAGAIFFG